MDKDTYLLHGYRYIGLNPVRACMTTDPPHDRGSSHAGNAFAHDDPLILPHASYFALGATRERRCAAYRTRAMETLAEDDLDAIAPGSTPNTPSATIASVWPSKPNHHAALVPPRSANHTSLPRSEQVQPDYCFWRYFTVFV